MKRPVLKSLNLEIATIAAALRTPWPYILAILAATWAGLHAGFLSLPMAGLTLFGAQLGLLAVADTRTLTLPHLLTGLLALTGLFAAAWLSQLTVVASLWGGLVAFIGVVACMVLVERFTGKPSLGGGDIWLVTAIGLWVGVGGLPMFLLATAGAGVAAVVVNRWRGGGKRFPFGPALAVGGWLAALYQGAYWQAIQALTS